MTPDACRRTTQKGHILNKKPIVGVLVVLLANYARIQLGWKFASRVSAVAKNGLDCRFLGEYSLIFPNELFGNRQESDRNIVKSFNLQVFKVAKRFSRLVEPEDSLFLRRKLRQAGRVDMANIV